MHDLSLFEKFYVALAFACGLASIVSWFALAIELRKYKKG